MPNSYCDHGHFDTFGCRRNLPFLTSRTANTAMLIACTSMITWALIPWHTSPSVFPQAWWTMATIDTTRKTRDLMTV